MSLLRNTIAGIPTPPADLERFEHVTVADGKLATAPRSPGWPAVQRRWLAQNPTCAACGKTRTWQGLTRGWRRNEVHHVQPFHLQPILELDPSNLMTFCREHHFHVGHGGDWSRYVPNARDLAAAMLAALRTVPAKARRR